MGYRNENRIRFTQGDTEAMLQCLLIGEHMIQSAVDASVPADDPADELTRRLELDRARGILNRIPNLKKRLERALDLKLRHRGPRSNV